MAPSDEGAVTLSKRDWVRDMKKYNKQNIPFAQEQRKNLTPWERKLWYEFLSRYPVRFQRQKAIGNYIVDFYCAKARLAVELDGGGHYNPEQALADARRTAELEKCGISVIRICNLDIDRNFRGVCEFLDLQVQKSLPQSATLTAPSSEGALAQPKIFALGFFDGVHLGHQALICQCVHLARQLDAQPAAITFRQHPQRFFTETPPALINTLADRETLLMEYGIREVHALPVSEEIMSTNWQVFLEKLMELGAAGFVCGDDFRFGFRGEGNAAKLTAFCAEQNLPCITVGEQTLEGIRISSTHIRSLLEFGDMETAAKFLGHPHVLTGTVVPGKQLGRTIGIPTANLLLPEEVVVPRFGVYACKIRFDGQTHLAVTNIGTRPTVKGRGITVEPWILDFDGDLYGKSVTLEFHAFLRPEQKFPSLEALQTEIRKNGEETRKILGKS